MCMNLVKSMFESGEVLGLIKKLDPKFKNNFDAKKTSAALPTPAIKKTLPKQKCRLRSFSKLGYNPGRRSFLEGGQ